MAEVGTVKGTCESLFQLWPYKAVNGRTDSKAGLSRGRKNCDYGRNSLFDIFLFGIICVFLENTLGIYVVWRIYKNILLRHS